jgi:hypothetical protein
MSTFIEILTLGLNSVSNLPNNVTIYDAGDTYVEFYHTTNEWKCWKIINIENITKNEIQYIIRTIKFIGYDIVPQNIIASYDTYYSDTQKGIWNLKHFGVHEKGEPLDVEQLMNSSSCMKTDSSPLKIVKQICPKPVQSQPRPMKQRQQPLKPRQYPSDFQEPPSLPQQQFEQLLLLQQLQQQILQQQQQQSLVHQQSSSQEQIQQQSYPKQKKQHQKQLQQTSQQQPSSHSMMHQTQETQQRKKQYQQNQPLVPLMKPGSSSSIPIVPSFLLPARKSIHN